MVAHERILYGQGQETDDPSPVDLDALCTPTSDGDNPTLASLRRSIMSSQTDSAEQQYHTGPKHADSGHVVRAGTAQELAAEELAVGKRAVLTHTGVSNDVARPDNGTPTQRPDSSESPQQRQPSDTGSSADTTVCLGLSRPDQEEADACLAPTAARAQVNSQSAVRACGTISGANQALDDNMSRGPVVADFAEALRHVVTEPVPQPTVASTESAAPPATAEQSCSHAGTKLQKVVNKTGESANVGTSAVRGIKHVASEKVMQTQDKPLNRYLVAIGKDRDQDAFVAIYEHFSGRVKSFLMGKGMNEDIAEELMQEIMLTVWRRAESYMPEKAAASTWIFTIARNRRIDYLRGNSRVEVELDDELLDIESDEKTLEQITMDTQSAARLQAALEFLPKEQKQVVHLSYFRGQSHGDIAEWLQLPIGTVKSRIRLAMQNVRQRFEQEGPVLTRSETGTTE